MRIALAALEPASVSPELLDGNSWLIRLRWLAVAGIIGCTVVAAGVLHYPVPALELIALALVVAAYNVLLVLLVARKRDHQPAPSAVTIAHLQIGLDLVALTVLLHLSGGAQNPFAIYYLFHMIIAGILLSPIAAYAQATLAAALYAGLLTGEALGILRHISIYPNVSAALDLTQVLPHVGVTVSALYISVFLTVTITSKLRQREEQLARAMGEAKQQATACELAYDKLQKTQEMQLHYMRRVSHELRSPLASVSMMLRTIRDGIAGEVNPKQKDLLVRAEQRSQTGLELAEDLLTLSKMREAPLQEAKTELSAAYLIDGVLEQVAEQAAARHITITSDVVPGLLPIFGQSEALRTMLFNLVGNAVKYTSEGGQVTVGARPDDDPKRIVFSVADNGVGIAAEDIPRLFDEFFRTEAARRSNVHGTGLGLSIVALIVKANDGSVNVTSKLGKGTTFEVRLPVMTASDAGGEKPAT